MPIERDVLSLLACPICRHKLVSDDAQDSLRCDNSDCRAEFPVVRGRPVLINEKNSVFRIDSYLAPDKETGRRQTRLRRIIESAMPSITRNWVARQNYSQFSKLLGERSDNSRVLVVGGGELGEGTNELLTGNIRLVETDVQFGSRTSIIADGHDLPFPDETFDGAVIQAVLEHVLDPYRCVEEIHRVLKPAGLVYAETPFMYPVHLASHDFMRFSRGAHRRLFRGFSEIRSGVGAGPGQALALLVRGVVCSSSEAKAVQVFASYGLPFLVFWLKYVDYFLIRRPRAEDFGSTMYFLGRKADSMVSDTDIIEGHWTRLKLKSA